MFFSEEGSLGICSRYHGISVSLFFAVLKMPFKNAIKVILLSFGGSGTKYYLRR